ncbi:NADH-ubiquinone oxidoreductase chain M [hydrothermal vent metagenome]|uniref:NADH-ubiquinone oxidoreductase chain M n=1 Tax=hydrothermal vent metagenome TaxID=652676 RepID=A0A3B0SPE6_9ZZZZ
MFPVLAFLVGLPVVAAIVIALIPKSRSELLLPVAFGLSLLPLAVAGYMVWTFNTAGGFQWVESTIWLQQLRIGWTVGVDGISLFLVALTAFLFPISILASANISDRLRGYLVSLFVLETGVLGVFIALDLVLFFVFFEIVLIPMFFMIGIWGSSNRRYAAIKFFVYTAFGSAFLLVSIIALAVNAGPALQTISFQWNELAQVPMTSTLQTWLFFGFAIAFAIKVPLFPLHTWLPDAHTEAPTAGSVLLAGVLLKMGTYGFIRFNLILFPEATVKYGKWIALLAVIGIVYAALVATVQPDIKRLVAYSSVSHLGFIVLGIFALTLTSVQGGIIQMVNHGLSTGALFLLIGMIYERTHTRKIADYGGLASTMPIFSGFFLFAVFASVGLPGLNGFIGEFMVLIGSWQTFPVLTVVAASGVVLAAVYLLWAYERVFTGPPGKANKDLEDLNPREIAILVPIAFLIVLLGVYPKPVLDRMENDVNAVISRIEQSTSYERPTFDLEGQLRISVPAEQGNSSSGESSEGSE